MSARGRLAAIAALTLVAGVAAIALVAHRLLGEWLTAAIEGYDAVLPLPRQVSVVPRRPVSSAVVAALLGVGAVPALVVAVRRRGCRPRRR